nr:unnamed protein product [Spirometra erinaceieuropaei]
MVQLSDRLGCARRKRQDWFADNDVIKNVLIEENSPHKAYVDRFTDDNKAAFYRGCRLMQKGPREMQDSWAARKIEENCGCPSRGEVAKDFKDATVVHLYKRKGNRQLYHNHRGIPLFNIAGKVFACFLPNRLNYDLKQGLLPESQCGFPSHRVTASMILPACQLQGKCQEMWVYLYSTFVDLTRTFTTVKPEGITASFEFGLKFSTSEGFNFFESPESWTP